MKKYVVLIFYKDNIYAKFKGYKRMSLRKYLRKLHYVKTSLMWYYPDTGRPCVFTKIDISRDSKERIEEIIKICQQDGFEVYCNDGFMSVSYPIEKFSKVISRIISNLK